MLQFLVFDDEGPARTFPLGNAYMLGRDEVAQRAEIDFRDGRIRCRLRGPDPAALCVQQDAGSMGRLMLQTPLLPQRAEPYLLSLELARQRIKQFIVKSEEWQMFDLPPAHAAIRLWEEARELFTLAVNDADPVSADRAARRSVVVAVDASERLAMAHSEVLLHRRFGTRAASSTTFGVGVWPGRFDAAQQAFVEREADIVSIPLTWRDLEVVEGRYDWERTDRWMSWAHARGKPIVAGPLLELSPRALPPWVEVWQNDFDTLRDLAYDHLAKVVERYRQVVGIWSLGAGLNVNDHFGFGADQLVALLRTASVLVRQMRRGARTMIELSQPFGEHAAGRRESVAPLSWLDRVVQEGLHLDCLGVRVRFGLGRDGLAARDLMQVSAMLDRLLPFELPVMVTGLGVPAERVDPAAGQWHGGYSPELQAEWATRLFSIAMSKPFVEAVVWGDLADHAGQALPRAGLLTETGEARPAAAQLAVARRRLRKPLGLLKVSARAAVLGEVEG
ncbi:MAG TPA: hypothetical protein PKC43_05855 [Phycisphaerales bacterium]|nr:hypothetical protein [Phycisphaerales bacterium]HMP36957.1 hypothetical protein [Phycisphaerales bacterium]